MPRHKHFVNSGLRRYGRTNGANKRATGSDLNYTATAGFNGDTTFEGGSQPHNNMTPYFGVYTWKRTS